MSQVDPLQTSTDVYMVGHMTQEALVRDAFAKQAEWCANLGSPFTARLMEGFGQHLDRSTDAGRTVLDWKGPPDALGDAVPLRLAGALHALVRRGRLPELAKVYPPNTLPTTAALTSAAMAALREADAEISEWLRYVPQTNEVARSAVLYPGLMVVAAETKLPLALFEIGASAGLNLIPDRYAYLLGDMTLGQCDSPVVLSPKWSGALPTSVEPNIQSRQGCDRNPLDVSNASHRERLIAYIWADQMDRISRVEAAVELARKNSPRIDAADAADWVDQVIGSRAEKGVVRVLCHSIAYQYFPDKTKHRIASRMEIAGWQATHDAPLAWLAFEQYQSEGPRLTLRLWPGDGERVLALGDAHGREVQWLN